MVGFAVARYRESFSNVIAICCGCVIGSPMLREEATAIADGGRELIIEVLLRMSAEIDELKRQVAILTKDSSNSSMPPSSDGPKSKPKPRPPKKSRKRNPGGQPGHKGSYRKLIPEDEVDKKIPLTPETCDHCGKALVPEADGCSMTGRYLRSQQTDIPEPKPVVTEYQQQCLRCSCGAETWAKLPREARSAFGPRLAAFLGHLTGLHRVTRRGCEEISKTIFNIDISLGSVCKLHEDLSRSLESACEKARLKLSEQAVLNADETGWKNQGARRWLWGIVAPTFVYFHIDPSRGSKVLKDILGEVFNGTLCSDMYSAYKAYHKGIRQFCWAHIIRDIRGVKHACRSPDAVNFSKNLLGETGRMFEIWHAFKDGHLDRETLVLKSVPIRARMSKCLQQYRHSSDYDVKRASKSLLNHWDGLFTFLKLDGVEPTNNSAESAVRPAVQWRKICFGNQSEEGELLTARLLTATRTCIMQERSPFELALRCFVWVECSES